MFNVICQVTGFNPQWLDTGLFAFVCVILWRIVPPIWAEFKSMHSQGITTANNVIKALNKIDKSRSVDKAELHGKLDKMQEDIDEIKYEAIAICKEMGKKTVAQIKKEHEEAS